MTTIHEVPAAEFLDRQARMRTALAELAPGNRVDTVALTERIRALLREVAPLRLIPGMRYRFRTLGGRPEVKHLHGVSETGAAVDLDVLQVPGPEWLEREGVYRGRAHDGPFRGLLLFEVACEIAALADIDVLRLEEVG